MGRILCRQKIALNLQNVFATRPGFGPKLVPSNFRTVVTSLLLLVVIQKSKTFALRFTNKCTITRAS